jgi:hypothetical protein
VAGWVGETREGESGELQHPRTLNKSSQSTGMGERPLKAPEDLSILKAGPVGGSILLLSLNRRTDRSLENALGGLHDL